LRAAPVTAQLIGTQEKGAVPWTCFNLSFATNLSGDGKALWDSYQAIRPQLLADPEFTAQFAEWNKTSISEQARSCLTQIAAMRK
jgi:hypothetical protein